MTAADEKPVARSGNWEPVPECPFCLLTAVTAYANNVSMPMGEVRGKRPNGEPDMWIKCECLGRPVSLHEEMLRRHEIVFGKTKDLRFDGLRWVIWAESWGRKDPNEPPQAESGKTRKKPKVIVDIRQEQEHQGFPDACPEETRRLMTLSCPVNVRVPTWIVRSLDDTAYRKGTTVSAMLRELFSKHLIDIEQVRKIPRGEKREQMNFMVTGHHKTLLKRKVSALKENLGLKVSQADLVVGIVVREFAR